MAVLIFDRGHGDERPVVVPSARGAVPAASLLHSPEDESLAALTTRAYGRNTAALRDKIRRANASLSGVVRIPK